MGTDTVEKTLGDIQGRAERIKNGEKQRFPDAASAGDSFRQGDLYITLLEKLPDGCKPETARAQLAEGETQGSRHCLDSLEGVRQFALANPTDLEGPILVIDAPERTITHPEHGHVVLPGEGRVYGVTYQRDLDEQERARRVAD